MERGECWQSLTQKYCVRIGFVLPRQGDVGQKCQHLAVGVTCCQHVVDIPSQVYGQTGGPGQNLTNFQVVPIPILSVPTCSTSSHHDILKISKIIDHNLLIGHVKT